SPSRPRVLRAKRRFLRSPDRGLFTAGKTSGVQSRRSFGVFGSTALQGTDYLRPDAVARVMDTLRFLADSARYAYQMGFYVPESELDGTVHKLAVAVAANPGLEVRYR